MYNWSTQQLTIFDEIINPTAPVLSIVATAGASKTSSIVEGISRAHATHSNLSVRYLVFGNAPAAEAREAFDTNAIVSTLHSYAYHYTVRAYNLNRNIKQYLTWRDLHPSIRVPFGMSNLIIDYITGFCKSPYYSIQQYLQETFDDYNHIALQKAEKFLDIMMSGAMCITHDFYLKLFHIEVMNGNIQLPFHDKVILEEAQDLSRITLDIAKKIPTNQLILIGDPNQAVFSFLGLVNGFAEFPDARVLHLSKSFRVSNKYAPAIQQFLRDYLEPDAEFIGNDYDTEEIITRGYLTRTNHELLSHMIECDELDISYRLVADTKIKQMFKLPLALIYAKQGYQQKDPTLKHLQMDIDDYYTLSESTRARTSLFAYLLDACSDSPDIIGAIKLIMNFSPEAIISTYNSAEAHKKSNSTYVLATCHSVKGLTLDEVTLSDGLNETVSDIIAKPRNEWTSDDLSELALYFVGISRHRYKLNNATHLNL